MKKSPWFSLIKMTFLPAIMLLFCVGVRAQYISIPDSGFNAFVYNSYPHCFNNQGKFDTTCTDLLTVKSLNTSYQHISSLEGVQYFKALDSLKCNADTTLTYIPSLPKTLRVLECRNDSLTKLPTLPDSLIRLACEFNVLDSLPALPAGISTLTCYNNKLTSLPTLPAGLRALYCSGNQIATLPALPDSLVVLSCYSNKLTQLPVPNNTLRDLICSSNLLTSLPALPVSLRDLNCYSNSLSVLPALPDSLQLLTCSHNHLATLPALPNSLTLINCEYNNLTSIPALPDSLYQLFIDNNPHLKCLPQLNTIVDFEFFSTGIACLPNVGNVYISNPDTLNICDSTFNPNGCQLISGVKDILKLNFTLYPNPAKGFAALTVDENTLGGTVRIVDNTGRLMASAKLQNLSNRIDIQNLAAGPYIVLINDAKGRVAVSKLVVQ